MESTGEMLPNCQGRSEAPENPEGMAKGMLATSACGRCGAGLGPRMEFSEEKPGLSGESVETTLC